MAISRRNTLRAQADLIGRENAHRERLRDTFLARVPGEYKGFDILDVEDGWNGILTKAQTGQLRRYMNAGGSRFLLLHGKSGVGKTTLAVTLGSELVVRRGHEADFRSSLALLSDFSFDGGEALRATSEAHILILDDLGAGNDGMTSHQERSLWSLIEARWSNPEFRTIITTNMAINSNRDGVGISDWLGPSAWDRVSDDLVRIELSGESLRGT